MENTSLKDWHDHPMPMSEAKSEAKLQSNPKQLLISAEELKQVLRYDPDLGLFTWIKSTSKRINIGDVAGSDANGSTLIVINKKKYQANRLAWLYMTGEWPAFDVKYKNGMKDDIRWSNLMMGKRKR